MRLLVPQIVFFLLSRIFLAVIKVIALEISVILGSIQMVGDEENPSLVIEISISTWCLFKSKSFLLLFLLTKRPSWRSTREWVLCVI